MAEAVAALVGSLDGEARSTVCWPFPSDDERKRWFYTPTDHGGLPLAAMSPHQQQLTHRLVATGLSTPGYVTAATIVGLDNVLDHVEDWRTRFGRDRGRDPTLYYVRVFGEPGPSKPWGWRFGGHHVSLNFTVAGGEVVSQTPCFFGADPASAPFLGTHPLRPLGGIEDAARRLVRCLHEQQAAVAILSLVPPTDIVGANRTEVGEGDLPMRLPDIWRVPFVGAVEQALERIQLSAEAFVGLRPEHLEAVRYSAEPKGLTAAGMSNYQRSLLRHLLSLYLGRLPDALAAEEAEDLFGDRFDGLHFAWAGGTEPGQPHYYRVQGPGFLVEYDNVQREGNHAHAVWRNPDGDFGGDVLADHFAHHHPA